MKKIPHKVKIAGILVAGVVLSTSLFSEVARLYSHNTSYKASVISSMMHGSAEAEGFSFDSKIFSQAYDKVKQRTQVSFHNQNKTNIQLTPIDGLINNTHMCNIYILTMLLRHTNQIDWQYQYAKKYFNDSCANQEEFQETYQELQRCLTLYEQNKTDYKNESFQNYLKKDYLLNCTLPNGTDKKAMYQNYLNSKDTFCSNMNQKLQHDEGYFASEKKAYDASCA